MYQRVGGRAYGFGNIPLGSRGVSRPLLAVRDRVVVVIVIFIFVHLDRAVLVDRRLPLG